MLDFFEHQDRARRNTAWLVFLFVLSVASIITIIYFVISGLIVMNAEMDRSPGEPGLSWFNGPLLLTISGITIAIVAVASIYKIAALSTGGSAVGEMLGGRVIDPGTADLAERRILNVVEEMAIASGTPVPPVYLMENEHGINAFAAGYSTSDAIIGITRGCIDHMNREELQGVVAHEFSHILNGDMRLNIRLIGVLYGILVLSIIGQVLMRVGFHSSGRRRRGDKDPGVFIGVIGLVLFIAGIIGVFFGNIIKAAVSRQREYLADAAAVQFTRQPDGIAGALKKIGGYTFGSHVKNAGAEEISHMFFSQALTSTIGLMFATHPPLEQRIRRVDPGWDGKYPKVDPTLQVQQAVDEKLQRLSKPLPASVAGFTPGSTHDLRFTADERAVIEQIGQPSPAHVQFASRLIESLPAEIVEAVHDAHGARAVMYALLLDDRDNIRRIQLARLDKFADKEVVALTKRLHPHMIRLGVSVRLPVIDLALPVLRRMSPTQYATFKTKLLQLIQADDAVDIFEWSLQHVLLHHLDPHFTGRVRPRANVFTLNKLTDECSMVLSTLAYAGNRDDAHARMAFDRGAQHLKLLGLAQVEKLSCTFNALNQSLASLETVAPALQRRLLVACTACIFADGQITQRESELLRAISDSLGVAMPPVLSTADTGLGGSPQ